MPNISIDFFWEKDFANFTIYKAGKAPKAKPEWKYVKAKKLPPKESKDLPSSSTHKPPPRPKINASRFGHDKETSRITDVTDTEAASKKEAIQSQNSLKSQEAVKIPKNPKSPEAVKPPKNPKSPAAVKSPKTSEPTSASPKKITT